MKASVLRIRIKELKAFSKVLGKRINRLERKLLIMKGIEPPKEVIKTLMPEDKKLVDTPIVIKNVPNDNKPGWVWKI